MRGHIRKRGNKWAVVVEVGRSAEGRRQQRWHSGFSTKKAAESALTKILGKLQKGDYVEPSKGTLDAFLQKWIESSRVNLRPGTWQSYKTSLDAYVRPALGQLSLQQLTPALLNKFYADQLAHGRCHGKGGLSAPTVRRTHTILRKALSDAVRWRYLSRNPCDDATPPKPKPAEMKTWNADELRAFLEQAQTDRLYAAFLLAATTGMRRGEVLGVRWNDLDLDAGRLSVTQTLIAVQYQLMFSTPKTAKGRRSVALDSVTVAELRRHKARQNEERLTLGGGWPDHDLVFTQEDGSPVHPETFSRDRFQRYVKAAELPRIKFHGLRHSHATLALAAGIHPKVVSERLGHASVSFTLDRYSHSIPALEEEAAEKVARLVFG